MIYERRCTIDVVITKMAKSFENKDNILRDWAKGIEQVREAARRKIKPFRLENDSEKLEQSQSAVERD